MSLKFRQHSGPFAVCQLPADAAIPDWATGAEFVSITRCADELSIVCLADRVPEAVKHDKPWVCFQLQGPFPFQMTGVLASFLDPLAQVDVPIFAISTFNTDYVLVKEEFAEKAITALRQAGHETCRDTS
jgi:hypothetical protein